MDDLQKLLDAATPGPWGMETVTTSCGICHKIGPFPHEWRGGSESHACLYDDYPPSPMGFDSIRANARLIALAPTLARQVIAARKLAEALEAIADEHQVRGGYCQSDISTEPVLNIDEMQAVALAALAEWEATQ